MKRKAVGMGVVLGLVVFVGSGLAEDATATDSSGRQQPYRLETPPWLRGDAAQQESPKGMEQDFSADFQILNILGRWWMPQLGDGSHMSTVHSSEIPNYGQDKFQGQMFYIPAGEETGTTHPLYRLVSIPQADRMDSVWTDEGGYTLEGPLGHPFTSQQEGTESIKRWFKGSDPFDHMTARSGESPSGYTEEGGLGYGYPRIPVEPARHCTDNFVVQGGGVQMAFSKVAGGTVWELRWNGKQFVNDWEYGRQIQAAVFWSPGDVYNPTEGGDSRNEGLPMCETLGPWSHGSPLLSYDIATPVGFGPIVTTRTQPINFDPKPFICPNPQPQPCDPDHPILWKGRIEKTVTLNHQGHGKRIKWELKTTFPSTIVCEDPMPEGCVMIGIAASHLTSEFSTLYVFDAATQVLSEDKAPAIPDSPELGICTWPGNELWPPNPPHLYDPELRPGAGGLIAATPSGSHALGIYHRPTADFPHLNAFAVCAWTHGDGGQYGARTYMPQIYQTFDGIAMGDHSHTAYLVVGTLSDVQAEMVAMYQEGL